MKRSERKLHRRITSRNPNDTSVVPCYVYEGWALQAYDKITYAKHVVPSNEQNRKGDVMGNTEDSVRPKSRLPLMNISDLQGDANDTITTLRTTKLSHPLRSSLLHPLHIIIRFLAQKLNLQSILLLRHAKPMFSKRLVHQPQIPLPSLTHLGV